MDYTELQVEKNAVAYPFWNARFATGRQPKRAASVGLPCRRGARAAAAAARPMLEQRREGWKRAGPTRQPPRCCAAEWKTWRHVKNFTISALLLVDFFSRRIFLFVLTIHSSKDNLLWIKVMTSSEVWDLVQKFKTTGMRHRWPWREKKTRHR